MKIIRAGVLPENVIYEGTCPHCFAMVECNRGETQQRDLGDRYSGAFVTYSVRCPTAGCNHTIALTEKVGQGVMLSYNDGKLSVAAPTMQERLEKLAGKAKR